jgi:hypothetical protein
MGDFTAKPNSEPSNSHQLNQVPVCAMPPSAYNERITWDAFQSQRALLRVEVTLKKMSMMRSAGLITLLLIVPLCLSAGDKKKKPPEQFCTLSFVVLRASNGKPIKNASVVIHSLQKDGSQDREGFQLKTDADGKTFIDDIPYGKLRLQVLAHSFQTYGDDIEVKEAKQEFVIRLKPPADQVSIY